MFITIWKRLGISPTNSENAIRDAYVQAVKQCHPEDKPEEWALLHDAYLQALQFAREEIAQSYIPARQAEEYPVRDDESESEYSDDFRASLSKSQETASTVISVIRDLEKKRSPISYRQVRPLMEMLFNLRPDIESDNNAAEEGLRFISAKLFTREAYNALFYDLQEWNYALPQTPLRPKIKETIDKVEKLRAAGNEKSAGGKDALFSWGAAIICMLWLMRTMSTGNFFAIIVETFCFFMVYRLKSKKKLFIPDENRFHRIWRVILVTVLVAMMIGSCIGCGYFSRQGVEAIYEQVENNYPRYDPSLDTGAVVSLELAQKPSYICKFIEFKEVNQSATNDSPNRIGLTFYDYYDAVGANNQRVLIYVQDTYADTFSDLQMPCTIYGTVSTLVMKGTSSKFLFGGDADSLRDNDLAIRTELSEAAEEIGDYPVFRYNPSIPAKKTVLAGYEPGRYPYCICWSICLGCVVHLALIVSRSVPLKKKWFVE